MGLRLRQGDDFPYCTADGFSPEFLRAENHLAARTPEGGLCRDEQGKVRLECTCGLVLSGHTDPTNPLFTPGGSAWTNDARPLLHVPADQDPRLHPRNRCIHEGFQSVALIPIHANREIVGLLQLNDCRRGRFTLELVQFFEGIAASLGGAVARTQLEDQNRQLQKAESLGRMAGAIAHHFNNQLQAVLLNLELAQRDRPGPATPSAHLAVALQSAHKAAEVSGLMLTYLGQTTAQHAPLDLCVACQQSLLLVRAALPGGVVLETDWPAPGPTVSSNTHQLQQVLTCLLTNAWEALTDAPGSIRLSVRTVSAAAIPTPHRFPVGWQPQAQDYACLEVADTGGGIAGPALDNVFDPFFSTKPTSRGLGLSVVLGLVRAHDGAITVESQPGCGSVFRVFLPRSTAALARRPQLEVPARPAPGSGTVLVVDDEPVIRETVALALKRFGFTVLQAHDGVAALEVFGQHPEEIRCVLCDLTMPRMGGWETLLALRKLRPGLPVILSSGYSEEQALAGQHPELPQAFLRKPYEVKTLYAVVTQALASRPDGAPLEPKPGIGPQVVSKSCR